MQACGQAAVAALGSSFALKRSSLDRSTEGVDAPTSLLRLGIDNMVDLADGFDDSEELLAALGAADQRERAQAIHAWEHSRRRCQILARQKLRPGDRTIPPHTTTTTTPVPTLTTSAPAPLLPPPPPPPPSIPFRGNIHSCGCLRGSGA